MEFKTHCVLAFVLRFLLVAFSYVQDAMCEVRYTDVDYRVFTDAAFHLSQGRSPFLRPTYRYTPLVAFLLLPNVLLHGAFGKLLFSLCDVLAGVLIHDIQRTRGHADPITCSLLWLYNPLPAVLSTRGSSESLVTLLVLLCVRLVERRPGLGGLVYGLAVHFKIYPCIYAASLYFVLTPDSPKRTSLARLLLPNKPKVAFVVSSAFGFLAPTLASSFFYGEPYIREALLYHVTRKDVRHNFSPFFYPLYLLETESTSLSTLVSYAGFLLQAMLVGVCSVAVRPLPAALFLQTFLFVSLNKVCTSQYFAWYLCLLPLVWQPRLGAAKVGAALIAWAGAQGLWLAAAHRLEFGGQNVFALVFAASLIFFGVNAALAALFAQGMKKETKRD